MWYAETAGTAEGQIRAVKSYALAHSVILELFACAPGGTALPHGLACESDQLPLASRAVRKGQEMQQGVEKKRLANERNKHTVHHTGLGGHTSSAKRFRR